MPVRYRFGGFQMRANLKRGQSCSECKRVFDQASQNQVTCGFYKCKIARMKRLAVARARAKGGNG